MKPVVQRHSFVLCDCVPDDTDLCAGLVLAVDCMVLQVGETGASCNRGKL